MCEGWECEVKITGVTMGFDLKPTLQFDGKYVLPRKAERTLYGEYYKNGQWPTDPNTGEKLKIN